MYTTPLQTLLNILNLEAQQYNNRAVIGGMARFSSTWRNEAREYFGPEAADWVQEIADRLLTYPTLSLEERKQALAELRMLAEQAPPPRRKPPTETHPRRGAGQRRPRPAPASGAGRERERPPHTGLDSPVTVLRGVGVKQAQKLGKLGLHTIRDLLYFFPRRYADYSTLKTINRLEYGEEVTIIAEVRSAGTRQSRSGKSVFRAVLSDSTGFIEAVWFNQPHLANYITPGQQIVVSGKVDQFRGRLTFQSPEWEILQKKLLHTARIVPIYPLTQGITARWLRGLMENTVANWAARLPDHLPESVRRRADLLDLETAIRQIHFPDDQQRLSQARRRLAFDELFVLQIGLLKQRQQWRAVPGRRVEVDEAVLTKFLRRLPFRLTGAQRRALRQIVSDMRSGLPMNRLLQGDVGSGKTVVAAAAMGVAVAAGFQAAMMAPTAILAEQHYRTLTELLSRWPGRPPTIRLLTGNITGKEREGILAALAAGEVDILVGTHALIQKGVEFKDLALAVVDEQHRFGVRQRAALRQKGHNPHVLVMTATPIPRSLELTVWGHLDVSVINEMPPGRQPVVTRVLLPTERERAYSFVRSQIAKGRQAFIICPLVEESDKIAAKAAVEEYKRLQEHIFPDLRLGLLHGRMKSSEKDATMARFAQGELDILVSTAVVEVGIDVPNATVMLIEGAERFGLAQLHQFRGRVGRGEHASYCLLVSDSSSEEAQERLRAVEETNDGFVLAQKDLEMRGPGEFLGTRQSGFPDLKLAAMSDLSLIEEAREAARELFHDDPELSQPDNRLLARQVERFWKSGEGEAS